MKKANVSIASSKRRCKAKNKDGGPCNAPALANGFCFWHDPAREGERQAARLKGGKAAPSRILKLAEGAEIGGPEGIQSLLEGLLLEVMQSERKDLPTTAKKARAAGYLAGILLQSYEASDLEKRVAALEKTRDAKGGK